MGAASIQLPSSMRIVDKAAQIKGTNTETRVEFNQYDSDDCVSFLRVDRIMKD